MTEESTGPTTLDAREVEGEPFGAISAALEDLDDGETLLLINSFEPRPLYSVLEERGFEYDTEQVDDDEWHVHIHAR
jgi:uncharacterized protein (DUF2249 family)